MLHNLICSVNARLMMGGVVSESEKRNVAETILSSQQASDGDSAAKRRLGAHRSPMYPAVFVPRAEERAAGLHLITGEVPRTKILSDNAYELEAVRLLALWAREHEKVEAMLELVEERLHYVCFSRFCDKGECQGASVAYLRFWTAYKPGDLDKQWEIVNRMMPNSRLSHAGHDAPARGHLVPTFYMLSALNECAYEVVEKELKDCSGHLLSLLEEPWPNKPYTLLRKHVVRNALARVPGQEQISKTHVYTGENGRWHAGIS